MTAKHGLLASIVVILFAGPGCVCCGNKGYGIAREVAPECEVPIHQRNQVYVFAIGGMNPLTVSTLDTFREELNRKGFAKVGTSQSVHTSWITKEMKRIRTDDPNAVFVLVGLETGNSVAVKLAETALAAGTPISAIVLIDASGETPLPNLALRTLVVSTQQKIATNSAVEVVTVPATGRCTLPTDARTIDAIATLLTELAHAIPQEIHTEIVEWEYPHAPAPRPMLDPFREPEWAFLFDAPGGFTQSIEATTPSATVAELPHLITATPAK